jgi:hypothetical protein
MFRNVPLITRKQKLLYSSFKSLINLINLVSVKPDFLDRSLIIELERITKDKRRKDEDIKPEFNK